VISVRFGARFDVIRCDMVCDMYAFRYEIHYLIWCEIRMGFVCDSNGIRMEFVCDPHVISITCVIYMAFYVISAGGACCER
jgi:hypothetical protein